MNDHKPSKTFPNVLMTLWRLTDPSTATTRLSNALQTETLQYQLDTSAGKYWVCSETGQLERCEHTNAEEIYEEHWQGKINAGGPSEKEVEKNKSFIEKFTAYKKSGRMFEVGSGLGSVVMAAQACGWQCDANEVSTVASDYIESKLSTQVFRGGIESVEMPESTYDVVLLNNVFEHLASPSDVLKKIHRSLLPGGVLYIHTLNAEALSLKTLPQTWNYYDEGHLFIPTIVSMNAYCAHTNFNLLKYTTHGYRSAPTNKSSEVSFFRNKSDKIVSTFAKRRNLGHRIDCLLQKPGA